MWANSKSVEFFFNFGSIVKELFNVQQLNQISKTQLFWNLPTLCKPAFSDFLILFLLLNTNFLPCP